MKLTLLLLLITTSVFSQYQIKDKTETDKIKELIVGDWHLSESYLYEGQILPKENNLLKLDKRCDKLTIKNDSIFIHKDSCLRFFKKTNLYSNFKYDILFDSIFNENHLKLFIGKSKKQKEFASYEIFHFTKNELILISHEYLSKGLDYISVSTIYIYHKKGFKQIMNNFKGEWFFNGNKNNIFLDSTNSSEFIFRRLNSDSLRSDYIEKIQLKFQKVNFKQTLDINLSSTYEGVYLNNIPFEINLINQIIYINKIPYHYEFTKDDKLILKVAKE